mgnify:CR=1 FL=1
MNNDEYVNKDECMNDEHMQAELEAYKAEIEKNTTVALLMSMSESFAAGINWKSNGVANDEYFSDVCKVLPDCNLDPKSTVMFHLKSHLEDVMTLSGDDSLDMNTLSYQGIMSYIRQHQKKINDSTHTYRVIRDLFEMSLAE